MTEPSNRDSSAQDASEDAFQTQIRRDLTRNYVPFLIHGLLGQTGFRIIQMPTFIPAYIHMLSGSNWLVGVARACQALGMFVTPIVGATLIEHRRRIMGMMLGTGALMRLQVLGLALAGFFLGREHNVAAVCILLGLFGFFTGIQSVAFSFFVAKLIPVERRGRLVGFRNFLSGVVSAGVSFIGGFFIDNNVWGNGYASLWLCSFVLTATGLCFLFFVRETPSPSVRPPSKVLTNLREVPALIRGDRDYAAYLWARALGVSGRMALPFFVLAADERLSLSGVDIGLLTVAFGTADTLGYLLWGTLADRFGFKRVLVLSLAAWIAAIPMLTYAPAFGALAAGFCMLGAGSGGFRMACMNLVLEFGRRQNLPMRIAVAQSTEQAVAVVAPLLGGILAETFSYEPVFWATAVIQSAGLVIAITRVTDPRGRASGPPALLS